MKVKFRDWYCTVHFSEYRNGVEAIELLIADDESNPEDCFPGEPAAVATVNIPNNKPGDGYVWIKDWSENQGILKVLTDAEILKYTGYSTATGFVHADQCKILKRTDEGI